MSLLLFYFLKLYNFGFYEIFVGCTSSEQQHPSQNLKNQVRIKTNRKKINIFVLNF